MTKHACLAAAAILFCACGGAMSSSAAAKDTLYDRLGGAPGVQSIVEDLFDRLMTDPRTEDSFARDQLDQTKIRLAAFICMTADGGCVYEGLSMGDAHLGHDVTEAQMNAMIELMQAAMRENDIPFRTQNEILARLAAFHRDIVTAR